MQSLRIRFKLLVLAPGEARRAIRSGGLIQDEWRDSRFVRGKQGAIMGSGEDCSERVRKVLGPDGVSRMAEALRCHPARFNHRPSGIVLAVIELLEAARTAGIADNDLPPRWSGAPPADDPSGLRERLATVLGVPHVGSILTEALGISRDAARYRLRGLNAHGKAMSRGLAEIAGCCELLELLKSRGLPFPRRWALQPPPAIDGRDLQARVKALLGREGSAVLAKAAGLTREYLSRMWAGERDSKGRRMHPSDQLLAIVELLETLEAEGIPRTRWPERWHRPAGRTAQQLPRDGIKQATASALPPG